MLYKNVMYDHKPQKVLVEKVCGEQQNNVLRIVLRHDIRQHTETEGEQEYTTYVADEVSFLTSELLTVATVEQHFNDWWAYGCRHDSEKSNIVSLEERLSAAEDALAYLLTKGGLS